MSRFAAFFMAVYLFFAGLVYGNAPVQVEILESPFDSGPVARENPIITRQSRCFRRSRISRNCG